MDGLILIDKPLGWTSHDAVSFLRGLLKEKRTGHTGTLDPAATGLLLVLLGKATRLAKFYGGNKKEYTATVKLGCETDTLDAEGKIIREMSVPALDRRRVEEVFSRFTGEIEQVPPAYSAVKIGGEPLYRRARKGLLVQAPPRRVVDRCAGTSGTLRETNFHSMPYVQAAPTSALWPGIYPRHWGRADIWSNSEGRRPGYIRWKTRCLLSQSRPPTRRARE